MNLLMSGSLHWLQISQTANKLFAEANDTEDVELRIIPVGPNPAVMVYHDSSLDHSLGEVIKMMNSYEHRKIITFILKSVLCAVLLMVWTSPR